MPASRLRPARPSVSQCCIGRGRYWPESCARLTLLADHPSLCHYGPRLSSPATPIGGCRSQTIGGRRFALQTA